MSECRFNTDSDNVEPNEIKLLEAIESGNLETVQDLIRRGVVHIDLYTLPSGRSILEFAEQLGQSEIARFLTSEEAFNQNDEKLQKVVEAGNLEQVSELIKSKSVNVKQILWPDHVTPLEIATELGNLEMVKLLVDLGFNPDSGNNFTPLFIASSRGYTDISKFLIKVGANINELHENGDTSLMVAASNGYLEIVKMLVDAGADVNIQNENEDTALACAAFNGHQEIFTYLLPLTASHLREDAEMQLQYSLQN